MAYLDPTKHRLSDSFLLSDFMGCDSVYRRGYRNRISVNDDDKLENGRYLAFKLEELQQQFGPCRVIYGYISPELSRNIVKYQDPDKPSYHRWDMGAAADITFPLYFKGKAENEASPVGLAHDIDDIIGYSRLITYSESNYLCFAVNKGEISNRLAFYENRYINGENRPHFVRYSANEGTRALQKEESRKFVEKEGWKGQGWPSYHGGGRKQYEHMPISPSFSVIDFLYNKYNVHEGKHNRPPENNGVRSFDRWLRAAEMASCLLTRVQHKLGTRVSITSAYNRWIDIHNWHDNFTLEFALPKTLQSGSYGLVDELRSWNMVRKAWAIQVNDETRIRVTGAQLDDYLDSADS